MAVTFRFQDDIAEVIMSNPPVNAITVGDTWRIRDIFQELAQIDTLRAIILTATGKGFNAGIDIKEMQSGDEMGFLVSSGEACYEAFDAIYRSPTPVIAAVNDYCLGLGVGLVGSCDMIVASRKARFGLPEVDNGSLGCASHLAKLVSPMKLREMTLTCKPATAAELHAWGSVAYLTEPEELMSKAWEVARNISAKKKNVIKYTKAALNHIDIYQMHTNYRLEQGYTYQLNVMGDGSNARNEFVAGTRIVTR